MVKALLRQRDETFSFSWQKCNVRMNYRYGTGELQNLQNSVTYKVLFSHISCTYPRQAIKWHFQRTPEIPTEHKSCDPSLLTVMTHQFSDF